MIDKTFDFDLEEYTKGEWHAGHIGEPSSSCNCDYILVEHLMGSIATVDYQENVADTECTPREEFPTKEEAAANMRRITACVNACIGISTKDLEIAGISSVDFKEPCGKEAKDKNEANHKA